MSFEKLPPLEEGSIARLTCGCGAHKTLDMDHVLAVGFGDCSAFKGDELIYSESNLDDESYWSASMVETLAKDDPDHDWRITFDAPLYYAEYQRQGDAHWVLVRKGIGFA